MAPAPGGKRGPKTALTDEELLAAIRAVLAAGPFHSEGHRKVHFQLRAQGIRVGRKRVVRLMGAHRLLVPTRPRHTHGDPAHAGTIITTRPDEMWGTDATRFYTEREGWCWFFGAVDHYTTGVMGWHIAKVGDRGAALEPLRQGMTTAFGSIAPRVALGVDLRQGREMPTDRVGSRRMAACADCYESEGRLSQLSVPFGRSSAGPR